MGKGKTQSNAGASLLDKVGVAMVEKTQKNKSVCPSLKLRTRIYGWGICLCIGFFLSLLSSGALKSIARGEVIKFTILYALGTITSLAASMFLWGPAAQCKSMFDPTRRITTIVFLLCLVLVITSAVLKATGTLDIPVILILLLVLLQYCAYFWYCLSFIPYGRKIVCKCCKKAMEEGDK